MRVEPLCGDWLGLVPQRVEEGTRACTCSLAYTQSLPPYPFFPSSLCPSPMRIQQEGGHLWIRKSSSTKNPTMPPDPWEINVCYSIHSVCDIFAKATQTVTITLRNYCEIYIKSYTDIFAKGLICYIHMFNFFSVLTFPYFLHQAKLLFKNKFK